MRCNHVQLYSTLEPDEIPERIRRRIERHLASCESCRKRVAASRDVAALVALKRYEQPDEAVMEGFTERFHHRLRLERAIGVPEPRSPRSWLWAEPAVVFRTALATVLLTLAVGRILWVIAVPRSADSVAEAVPPGTGRAGMTRVVAEPSAGGSAGTQPRLVIIRPYPGSFPVHRAVPRLSEPPEGFRFYRRGTEGVMVVPASYEF